MDPYSSPYIIRSKNPYNPFPPFPPKLQGVKLGGCLLVEKQSSTPSTQTAGSIEVEPVVGPINEPLSRSSLQKPLASAHMRVTFETTGLAGGMYSIGSHNRLPRNAFRNAFHKITGKSFPRNLDYLPALN